MPNAYSFSYGEVAFSEEDGTPIFSTTADLGLWTTVDEEPSPEPKWVRVSVPGADGSVDLSRALTGQVQYESREITLQFAGKRDTHAEALALVHRMRRALHGARVRVETMLTAQIGGWYVADCECDGTAEADGGVVVDVRATADPFIHVGSQTLSLPGGVTGTYHTGSVVNVHDDAKANEIITIDVPAYEVRDGTILGVLDNSPEGATSGRIWSSSDGANLLDVSMWPTFAPNASHAAMSRDGQRFVPGWLGWTTTAETYSLGLIASAKTGRWPSFPYSFPFGYFDASPAHMHLCLYATGTVASVSSPSVTLVAHCDVSEFDGTSTTDAGTGTATWAPVAGTTYENDLVCSIDLNSIADGSNVAQVLCAVTVTMSGVAGTNLRLMLALTYGAALQTWREADLTWVDVGFSGPLQAYTDSHLERTADSAVVAPYGVTVTRRLDQGTRRPLASPVDVSGTASSARAVPDDAEMVAATLDETGGTCGITALTVRSCGIGTATGNNLTMRSVPTLTSTGGGSVTVGGRTVVAGPGTVELPALTIPGGEFTARYSTYDDEDMTLTWEGGAL